MKTLWHSLEQMPDLLALPVVWREVFGDDFALFKACFLQTKPEEHIRFYPCPNGCAWPLEIQAYGANDIVAICRCESSLCRDIELRPEDIIPLELNWPRLARALARALGLEFGLTATHLPRTRQVGSWGAEAVPVFLTIHSRSDKLRPVVTELVARLRQPFILLSPTSRFVDAVCRELLTNVGASSFGLDNVVSITAQGTLHACQAPGDIFARFSAQPRPAPDEDAARQAFALVKQLEPESRMKPPSVLTVFRLYCIEELSAAQIARKCSCSKTTVIDRLNLIRNRTGVEPGNMRRFSAHFSKMEDDLADSRAAHVHRRRVIYDAEPDDTG